MSGVAGKWKATIAVKGVVRHLGTFKMPEEAAGAYNKAAKAAFGELARLNNLQGNPAPPTVVNPDDVKAVTFYLPPELHKAIKLASIERSTTMSALLEEAVKFYLGLISNNRISEH